MKSDRWEPVVRARTEVTTNGCLQVSGHTCRASANSRASQPFTLATNSAGSVFVFEKWRIASMGAEAS